MSFRGCPLKHETYRQLRMSSFKIEIVEDLKNRNPGHAIN